MAESHVVSRGVGTKELQQLQISEAPRVKVEFTQSCQSDRGIEAKQNTNLVAKSSRQGITLGRVGQSPCMACVAVVATLLESGDGSQKWREGVSIRGTRSAFPPAAVAVLWARGGFLRRVVGFSQWQGDGSGSS